MTNKEILTIMVDLIEALNNRLLALETSTRGGTIADVREKAAKDRQLLSVLRETICALP